ncbi:PepSY domain-containing protein [Bacillus kexueae]|uniref:PepSY domain-containing protein n=1 Tax=Aeribacillus kexueae TaxID=2078952 RepID=UPI001FAE9E58|nr:PepSY domain-containing protein [Bacillus kexueae]
MKWKNFLIGAGVGLLLGYSAKQLLQKERLSPNQALSIVKKMFKEKGPISGSWIYTIPQTITLHDLSYNVYKVGISRTFKDKAEQYEAFVDVETGDVLKIEKLT